MIVTGAAKTLAAGVTHAFIERGYNVVANSLDITYLNFAAMDRLAVVQGDLGDASPALRDRVEGDKDFWQDFEELYGTNLRGYINITQLAVKPMLMPNGGESAISRGGSAL